MHFATHHAREHTISFCPVPGVVNFGHLYYMIILSPFILKKYFLGAILGNYFNSIRLCLFISVQTHVCLFYPTVFNPVVVLLTSESPAWPLGSCATWLP